MADAQHNMIYSPQEQIPLGEPVLTEDGRPAIRLRYTTKRNQHKEEIVPLDYIFAQTINAAASRNPQAFVGIHQCHRNA